MNIIYQKGEGIVIEKKSRFIAQAVAVETQEQAMEIVQAVKKEYWDARHHCFAFVIGQKNEVQRFSDDGEPAGTAGKPILDLIVQSELCNCLVVVTRYFGGTLLGTGGLIRAYQSSAKEAIQNAQTLEVMSGVLCCAKLDYSQIGTIQHLCDGMGLDILKVEYVEKVHMTFLVEESKYVQFVEKIKNEFSGTTEIVRIRQQLYGKTAENKVILL